MTSFNILVLPGDGVGPEVTAEAVKVLRVVEYCTGITFHLTHELVGGSSYTQRGVRITREVLDLAQQTDAVLFGCEGGRVAGEKRIPGQAGAGGLLQLRKELNLYANLRPCRFASRSLHSLSVLRPDLSEGTDIMIGR
jgi:3-isopropylmalate dehydrogenase